jgi:hypothetical protein
LFDAGIDKTCPACQTTVRVPNTVVLKQSSGDKYPYLRPIDKLRQALAAGEPPFAGDCHVCVREVAIHQIPVHFDALVERVVSDDEGVQLSALHGIKLVVGESQCHWETMDFPFLLCAKCENDFRASQSQVRSRKAMKWISGIGILVAVIYLGFHNFEIAAAFLAVALASLWILYPVLFVMAARQQPTVDANLMRWLGKIRWFPEAAKATPEFKVSMGEPMSFDRTVFQIHRQS